MAAFSKREHLRRLVTGRNEAFRPLTEDEKALGFLGWHERGYLPHCDYPGLVQFVTFRLADSMPSSKCGEWEELLAIENIRDRRIALESYLDRGVGNCHLRNPLVAKACEDSLLYFHNKRYELLAWCVMPNHVHTLVQVKSMPLSKIVQSWKSFIATRANQVLKRRSSFWEPEYWDTFMRDDVQVRKAQRYIENNPVKARLGREPRQWPYSSARFRDAYERLVYPGAQSSSSASWKGPC